MPPAEQPERPDLTLPAFDVEKHYATWQDMLGRIFRPGDVIAVGITAGRSASIAVGMVRRINRVNASGEPYTRTLPPRLVEGKWVYPTPATAPDCTVTFLPLVDSSNRFGRWSTRDSLVGPEKIVLLADVSVSDLLRTARPR